MSNNNAPPASRLMPDDDRRAEITDEAKRRLAGREELTEKLLSIVGEGASALNISLKRVAVRPGWSHEHEDVASVVIYVEIEGVAEERFSLWDAVCDSLERLAGSLPENMRRFLTENVFVIVSRD